MAENFEINQEDPKYRKKIYDFLKSNFSDFNKSETDFYNKLDTDNTYSSKVYDVISGNFSDFGRKKDEFISLMSPVKKKDVYSAEYPTVSKVGGVAGISGAQLAGGQTQKPKLPPQPEDKITGAEPTGRTIDNIPTVAVDLGEEQPPKKTEFGNTGDEVVKNIQREYDRILGQSKSKVDSLQKEFNDYAAKVNADIKSGLIDQNTAQSALSRKQRNLNEQLKSINESSNKSISDLNKRINVAKSQLGQISPGAVPGIGMATSVLPTGEDPLKKLSQSIKTQQAELFKQTKGAKIGDVVELKKKFEDLNESLDSAKREMFPTVESAKIQLKKYPNIKTNETSRLAQDIVDDDNNVLESLTKKDFVGRKVTVPLTDAAVNYYSKKDDETGEKLRTIINAGQEVPVNFKAQLLGKFLTEDRVKELGKRDKAFGQKLNYESSLYWDRYPELANEYILHKIQDAREATGRNNPFLNIVDTGSTDNLVKLMVKTGDLTPQLERIYNKYTRPLIATHAAEIETPGIIESAGRTAIKGFGDVAKSVYEYSLLRKLREGFLPKGVKEIRELSDIALQRQPTRFRGVNYWTNLTGNLLGFAGPIAIGGGALKGILGLSRESKLAEKVMTGLTFGHDIYEQESKENKNPALAYLSALTQTLLWSKGSDVFAGLTKGIVRSASPDINKVLQSLQSGAITNKEASQGVIQSLLSAVKRSGIKVGESAAEVAGIQALNTAISNVFNGKFDLNQIVQSGTQTFQDMALGLALPTLLKTGPGARKTITDFHNDILADKENYRTKITDPEAQRNFDRLVKINESLQGRSDLTQKQKEQLRLSELQQQVLKEKADKIDIPELRALDEAEINKLSEEKKDIIEGKMPEEPVEKEAGVGEVKAEVPPPTKEEIEASKKIPEAEKDPEIEGRYTALEKEASKKLDIQLKENKGRLEEQVAKGSKQTVQDKIFQDYVDEMTKIKEDRAKEYAERRKVAVKPEEVGVGEVKAEVPPPTEEPSKEQQLKDVQEGNVVTFNYENESQVPDVFKDKISSKGEINGKPYVKVTVAKSLADYELGKKEGVGEVKPEVKPTVPSPTKLKLSGNFVDTEKANDVVNKIKELGEPNELNEKQVVINGVKVEVERFGGQVLIKEISAIEPGKGAGTEVLNKIKKIADNNGVEVILTPEKIGVTSKEDLIKWYKKNGFEEYTQGRLIYKPEVATEAKPTVPSPTEIKIEQVKTPQEIKVGDQVSWIGTKMTVESVNKEGGFDLRGVDKKTYTVKDARITDDEFGGRFVKEGEVKAEVKPEKFGVGFAPFRSRNVFTIEEDSNIRNSPEYKLYQENLNELSEGLGIPMGKKLDTWGGYVDSETGTPVQEVSNFMEIKATPDDTRLMAAVLGKAAPEMQDSVLIGNYNKNGAGYEHVIKTGSFKNAQEAVKYLKENGLEYFTINKDNGDIIILDLDSQSSPKIINLVKQLNENGINSKHKFRRINAEFIGSGDYDGIIAKERGRIRAERGFDIDAFISEAKGKYDKIKSTREAEAKVEVPAAAKTVADKVRALKIDISKLGEGGAQSNIAGVPIALYNTAIEVIAKAIEAGESVNKAISDTISKYKLDKNKDFDKDEFYLSIFKNLKDKTSETNPVYFDNLKEFASKSSFDNKIQFKKAIQDLLKNYLPKLKEKYGKDFNPSTYNEKTKQYLSDVLTKEALNAISEHPEAIGWYNEKTQSALDVISSIHPEIATNPEARGAFILPLAVMSNGNKVDFNFDLAEKQYKYFKENGRFNPDGNFGLQQSGIKKSLMLINSLLDNGLSMNDINKFLTSKHRAGDLKIKVDGKVKDLASGELANEPVYGAMILGPKIGNGFYMNLWGQFDQLTMDRWFMRTWGRHTNTLIEVDKSAISDGKKRISDALSEVKSDPESLSKLKSVLGKISSLSAVDLAKSIEKVSMDKEKRAILSSNPKTDELRKAANSLSKNISGEKEAPANGNERRFIRDVFNDVADRLKNEHGIDISMADLQAALWYPEKILYESFKGGKTFEEAAEGYTSESAPDYLNAAKKLATKLGINEEQINQALSRGRERLGAIVGEPSERGREGIGVGDKEILGRVKEALGEQKPTTVEGIKNAAKKIRDLKIKQEGLQANIAGIPIAIYNAAMETIATALEAGATLAEAINKAIVEHKLNKQKDFDSDQFIKKLEDATELEYPKERGAYAIPKPTAGEVPVQPEVKAGEPIETTGITHEQMNQTARELGLEEYEQDPETMKQWDNEAAERISKDPKAISKLLNKMRDGGQPDAVEQRMMIMYISSLKARIRETPTKELLDEFKRARNLSDIVGGRMVAKSLAARRAEVPVADTLADHLLEKEDAQGFPLSEKQIKEQTEKFDKLQDAKRQFQEAYDKEKVEEEEKQLTETVNQTKARQKRQAKKSSEERKSERKASIDAAREALKKIRTGEVTAVAIPLLRELQAIAPHVKDYVKSLVEEGVDKLDVIISDTYANFKDLIDGLSEKDISAIIRGEYDEKKRTRNQTAAALRLLKREAQLLKELEDAEAGLEKTKSDRAKAATNVRIEELKKKIEDARRLQKPELTPTEIAELEAKKAEKIDEKRAIRLQEKIKQLEDDLREGRYEKEVKPRPEPKLSAKTQALKDKVIELEKQKKIELEKDKLARRSKWAKGWDKVQSVLGINRIIQTSIDASIWARQLGTVLLNPRKWDIAGKFIKAGAKSAFSQKTYDRIMDAIHKSPDFDKMRSDGIRFNELDGTTEAQRNEMYPKSFIYKIPFVREFILSSQRIADGSLNVARYELYKRYEKRLLDQGITRESDPEMYKAMAKWVMNTTGSGNMLKAFENPNTEKLLGATFYGARLMASNFNTLNPVYYAKMPKTIRMEAMKDLASYTTTVLATALGLAAAGGNISLNPNDPDFLQIRFGKKVYDISGGKAAYIRTFMRWVEAGYARATKSKSEAKKATDFALNSTTRFFRNKLAPNTGYALTAVTGKDAMNRDFDWTKIYSDIMPLYFQDAYQAAKEDGLSSILTVVLPNIIGVGYSNYPEKNSADKDLDTLLSKNKTSDDQDFTKIFNYNEEGRPIVKEEIKEYIKLRDKKIEDGLTALFTGTTYVVENNEIVPKKYSDLNKDQVAREVLKIKTKATREAKKELFGEKQGDDIQKIVDEMNKNR